MAFTARRASSRPEMTQALKARVGVPEVRKARAERVERRSPWQAQEAYDERLAVP
jgi:hypothetical protein